MLETLYGTPLSDKHDNLVLSSDPARAICRAPGHSHVMFVTGTKMWLNGITFVVLFFYFLGQYKGTASLISMLRLL